MPEQHPGPLADRYELRTRIGRGTMGTVWRAYDRSLGREIAVKEIRQDPSLSPRQRQELRERMMREGRMAARVSHPSVATIHDVIVSDGIPWIIMELVEGRSLEQVIDEEGPLPPRLVAEIGYDLLGALRAAHAQDILHRDVKPANVLLTETGRVVLTDFGIAKALGDHALTQTGMVIGSPGYTAPERARGEYTGPESDLWSLGATLYFAVEGRPAYERATVGETLAALMTEEADPPAQAGALRPVLDGLLVKDHTARLTPERAAAMLRLIADTPTGSIPAVPPAPARDATARPDGNASAARPAGGNVPEDDDDDANRTMVVPRPTAAPRLPAPPPGGARNGTTGNTAAKPVGRPEHAPERVSGAASGAYSGGTSGSASGSASGGGDRHSTTVPGRLPGSGPMTPPPPGPGSGNSFGSSFGNGPAPMPGPHPGPQPGAFPPGAMPPGAMPPGGVPHGALPPGDGVPGKPPSLGTDLFAMQSPSGPDAKTQVRVLVTMGVALFGVLALILLGVFIFAK
ncbi:serine/threonine protein kinase [Microbispora sp. SCL1-1]|uniref:serine/threonine-protein kinase n=1 Tax=unclassified Microbispora TaxID=2614687 RepID=UPI001157C67B|nr:MULTISPECIES: serine/threonine-protein kinase [unclassified Microbispora]NJP27933.1 serine/threonine protein kinase [Microbispora sp. CL1-1]TQS10462.1 serine/threonine protein kinase [Microbispora sp. SCL1-1]